MSYLCASGNIRRYDGYTITATQPTSAADLSGLSGNLLTDDVAACEFVYDLNGGVAVLTISITIQNPVSGDKVNLMQQVSVINGA